MLILKPLSIDWSVAGAKIPAVTFIAQAGLPTRELAHMLDSLVRVSRRVGWNHFVIVVVSGGGVKRQRTRTRKEQFANEFNTERSPTRGQATIPMLFSPMSN